MFGALIFMWIFMPGGLTTLGILTSDIIDGACIPWGVFSSYAVEKIMLAWSYLFGYLMPMLLMLFCYSRIVHALKQKVEQSWRLSRAGVKPDLPMFSKKCGGPPIDFLTSLILQRVYRAPAGQKWRAAPSELLNICLDGAAVRRRTRDRKVAGSTPGRGRGLNH